MLPANEQTFTDLGLWLTEPNNHTQAQLERLLDENLSLPLFDLANQYWLIGMLSNQLKSSQVWSLLDTQVQAYLVEIEGLYHARLMAIKKETIDICQLLQNHHIDVILMKGVASLFNGIAEPISNRYMKDIDILIPEASQMQAYQIMQNNGYVADENYFDINAKNNHHAPPLLKNNVCYVEVHRWLLMKHLNKLIPTAKVWQNSQAIMVSSLTNVKQLCPTDQVVLAITHSEIQNGDYDLGHIDLHQLANLNSIARFYQAEIDWQHIKLQFERYEQGIVLTSVLYNAFMIFKLTTPITQYDNHQAKLHYQLCIKNHISTDGKRGFFTILMEQLVEYKKRNILLRYGKVREDETRDHKISQWCQYGFGLIKHMYFHGKKILTIKHLKPYIKRLLGKTADKH